MTTCSHQVKGAVDFAVAEVPSSSKILPKTNASYDVQGDPERSVVHVHCLALSVLQYANELLVDLDNMLEAVPAPTTMRYRLVHARSRWGLCGSCTWMLHLMCFGLKAGATPLRTSRQ